MPQFKSQKEIEDFYRDRRPRRQQSWWFRITQERWFRDWKGLKLAERSILLSLWLRSGSRRECYPSMRRLAIDLGLSRDCVHRGIKTLAEKGFIKIEKKIGQRGKYHRYLLLK